MIKPVGSIVRPSATILRLGAIFLLAMAGSAFCADASAHCPMSMGLGQEPCCPHHQTGTFPVEGCQDWGCLASSPGPMIISDSGGPADSDERLARPCLDSHVPNTTGDCARNHAFDADRPSPPPIQDALSLCCSLRC
jgi:hypothetical protein